MNHNSTESNSKVRATAAIWGCATSMLGLCIPLVAISKSGVILPLESASLAGAVETK